MTVKERSLPRRMAGFLYKPGSLLEENIIKRFKCPKSAIFELTTIIGWYKTG